MPMIGGAIALPVFQSLFDSLNSNDLFMYGINVLEEVSKWEPMLKTIFEVLDYAEKLQMTDGAVQSWFSDLRDLAYDVDDVLDEVITHAETETSSSKVGRSLRSGLSSSTSVKFSSDMIFKVQSISLRLENVKTLMNPKNVGGRNIRVNEEMTSTHDRYPSWYRVEILSNDDCLSLFALHALNREEFRDHMEVMEVGQEIVKKCKFLPLAAKALGGLLRGTPDRRKLLQNKLWETTILPKQMDLPKNLGGRNNRVNEERLAKVFGREDDHKAIFDMRKSKEQSIDHFTECGQIDLLGVRPSFREQHAGRRRPVCVSLLLLGNAPSFQLIQFTGRETTSEPNAASNRFRRGINRKSKQPPGAATSSGTAEQENYREVIN